MSNYIQNNVEFTIQQYTPTKLGNRASTATYNALVNNKGSYIINAVEIDWNGASICDKTLNTTGEVLSILQTAYNYATSYTGTTSLVSGTTELAKINNQSLKFGGSLTIETASDYELPTASESTLGGIKVGNTLSISAGVLNAKATGTVTGVKINNATKSPSNGVVDLGTVLTTHQDISGKADKDHNHEMNQINGLQDVLTTISEQIDLLSARIAALEKYHENVLVTGISLSQTSATLTGSNATLTLTPTITPNNATNKSVTWTSTDTSVATVTSGVVTPKKAGTTTIKATSTDGSNKSGSCVVTVKEGTTTWSLSPISTEIKEGEQKTFSMSVSNSNTFTEPNANNTNWVVQYRTNPSDDTTYTFVNHILSATTGSRVTATAPQIGSNSAVTYYISATNTGTTKTATLTVSSATVSASSVVLNKTSATLTGEGASTTLTATVYPEAATNKSVTWSSNKTSVATVSSTGKVSAVGVGNAIITATANDGSGKSASCNVTVDNGSVSSITLSPATSTLSYLGGKVTITPTISENVFGSVTVTWNNPQGGQLSKTSTTGNSSIEFTAPSNSATTVRQYNVTVTCGGKTAGCTINVGGKPQETMYYWYAGQTNPASNSTITSTVGAEGWRLIDNINNVSQSNPLFDTTTTSDDKIVGTARNYWYIAVPANKSYKIYDSDYVDQINAGNFVKQSSTITFNNVNYTIYKSVGTARNFDGYTIY